MSYSSHKVSIISFLQKWESFSVIKKSLLYVLDNLIMLMCMCVFQAEKSLNGSQNSPNLYMSEMTIIKDLV